MIPNRWIELLTQFILISRFYVAECLCKACAVELTGEPGWACYCHCSQCRRALSADYATLVGADPDKIKVTRGEFRSYSTGKEERYRCAKSS